MYLQYSRKKQTIYEKNLPNSKFIPKHENLVIYFKTISLFQKKLKKKKVAKMYREFLYFPTSPLVNTTDTFVKTKKINIIMLI